MICCNMNDKQLTDNEGGICRPHPDNNKSCPYDVNNNILWTNLNQKDQYLLPLNKTFEYYKDIEHKSKGVRTDKTEEQKNQLF